MGGGGGSLTLPLEQREVNLDFIKSLRLFIIPFLQLLNIAFINFRRIIPAESNPLSINTISCSMNAIHNEVKVNGIKTLVTLTVIFLDTVDNTTSTCIFILINAVGIGNLSEQVFVVSHRC